MWLLASILDSTHLIRLWQVRWSWPQNLINVILKFVKASQALIKCHRTKTMFFNSWFSTYVFHSPSRGLSSNLLCNEGRAEMVLTCAGFLLVRFVQASNKPRASESAQCEGFAFATRGEKWPSSHQPGSTPSWFRFSGYIQMHSLLLT